MNTDLSIPLFSFFVRGFGLDPKNETNLPADAWASHGRREKSRLFSLQFSSLDFLESCG
jgi:hypothetical protein